MSELPEVMRRLVQMWEKTSGIWRDGVAAEFESAYVGPLLHEIEAMHRLLEEVEEEFLGAERLADRSSP